MHLLSAIWVKLIPLRPLLLCSEVRGVTAHIDRRFARLADGRAARIRPDDYYQAVALRLFRVCANLLVHLQPLRRSRVDRKSNACTAEAQRVCDTASERLCQILLILQRVVIVDVQDQRDLAREFPRPRLEKPQRSGVCAAPGFNRELDAIPAQNLSNSFRHDVLLLAQG